MRKFQWLVVAIMCLLAVAPSKADAQPKEQAENFVRDVLWSILGPNWNAFANLGLTTNGRFLLQEVGADQRSVRSNTGFNVGLGAGVDFLLRQGLRFSYNYSSNNLVFRTDNGDGSRIQNIDPDAELSTHVVAIEIIRYMLPPRMKFTPYGTLGVLGAWWGLDEGTVVVPAGGSTRFHGGYLASFGFQGNWTDQFSSRLEVSSASVGNPFTGRRSFVAFGGTSIDEPQRVNKTDYRLVGVYYFSRPDRPERPRGPTRRRP